MSVSLLRSRITYVRTYLVRSIIIVTAVSGLLAYYLTSTDIVNQNLQQTNWNTAASTFTLFVGIITLGRRYIATIIKRGMYWPYMIYAVVLMPIWTVFGLYAGVYSDLYQTAFLSTKITLHIAILGQLCFFLISGMYRVLRMKSFRTTLYTCLTVLMVVCNASWMLAAFPQVNDLGYWLLNNPSMAMTRTLLISGAFGGVILSLRILMGLERGSLRATEGA
jgi:hypothetical protein